MDFSRQRLVLGAVGHAALARARVLVAGLGAVGIEAGVEFLSTS